MCGIAGVAGAGDSGPAIAEKMTAMLVHRGPDDEGSCEIGGVALGMRRLSIIDLEGGHQPMATADGTAIVFNGEIYNYQHLRDGLLADQVSLTTASDTEVVLQLWRLEGHRALQRLEGMFAFCIVEADAQTLHLVRDRFGKKPLYYTLQGGRFLFSSELKSLLAGLPSNPTIQKQSVHDYLALRYVPGPETIWQGIYKLPPGHRLTFDLRSGGVEVQRWWNLDIVSAPEDTMRNYLGEFTELFLQAVEKRYVASDVEVGVLLSGGLDSSAVTAAAIEMGHQQIHTYSVGFADGGPHDELAWAREVANHLGTVHREVTISADDFLQSLRQHVWITDEPLADLATIPLLAVSNLAREDVKVVLSGEGSDELLAGYDIEQLAARLARLQQLDLVPRWALRAAARLSPRGGAALGALGRGGWSGYLAARGAYISSTFTAAEQQSLWRDSTGLEPSDRLIQSWYAQAPSDHPIDQLQQAYIHSWLVEDLLMKADKASMAASLELRAPFLDHALAEWAATAPLVWKVGSAEVGWESKRILRSFARGRLPQQIITRPKQGFPVPAYDALRGSLGEWAAGRLSDAAAPLAELLDVGALTDLVPRARAGDGSSAQKVWNLLVLDAWLERWT